MCMFCYLDDYSWKVLKLASFLCLMTLALAVCAEGATIVSVTTSDPSSSGGGANLSGFIWATSWTQADAYQNVRVSAELTNSTPLPGSAYLTTQIGPGTTNAEQISAGLFVSPPTSTGSTLVTLFTGLTLEPGTT